MSVLTPLTETLPAWKARIWNENPDARIDIMERPEGVVGANAIVDGKSIARYPNWLHDGYETLPLPDAGL